MTKKNSQVQLEVIIITIMKQMRLLMDHKICRDESDNKNNDNINAYKCHITLIFREQANILPLTSVIRHAIAEPFHASWLLHSRPAKSIVEAHCGYREHQEPSAEG